MTDLVLLFERQLSECHVVAIRLEDGVPTKHVLSSWFHDLARTLAYEDLWFNAWTLAESVDALRVGGMVIKRSNHLPEAFTSDFIQKLVFKLCQRPGPQ